MSAKTREQGTASLTHAELRDALLAEKIMITQEGNGDFFTLLPANEDFKHHVGVVLQLNEEMGVLTMMAQAGNFEIPAERLGEACQFCLEKAANYTFGTPYMCENALRISSAIFHPGEVPREWLVNCFIKVSLGCFWNFFVEAGRLFEK